MADCQGCDAEGRRNRALSNALSSIVDGKRFPRNAFAETWVDYWFFEPSVLFEKDFISIKDLLVRHNDDRAVAVVNLGNRVVSQDVFFLEESTAWKAYLARLIGDGSALNWMFLMDRYVFASDRGNWVIYCEKENDLAALAVRGDFPSSILPTLTTRFRSRSIHSAAGLADKHSFDFNGILPSWKLILLNEYGQSNA